MRHLCISLALFWGIQVPLHGSKDEREASAADNVWYRDGKPAEKTSYSKSLKGFAARLSFIKDESFFEEWKKPEAPSIPEISTIKRGEKFYGVIFYAGLGHDDKGSFELTYDLYLIDTTGKEHLAGKGAVGARGEGGRPDDKMHMGASRMTLIFDDSNPSGVYIVKAAVRDTIRNTSLTLTRKFTLEDK